MLHALPGIVAKKNYLRKAREAHKGNIDGPPPGLRNPQIPDVPTDNLWFP